MKSGLPGPASRPRVTVVGLGPGRPGLITAETLAAIERVEPRWLRTGTHPSASVVKGARTFDFLYENEARLEDVYHLIVEELAGAAASAGHVLYAVPGSPSVAERTVELLRADPRVEIEVLPAVSFADLAFQRLGVDPVAVGGRLADGQRFATEVAGQRGPFLVAQCDSRAVLSEVKLAIGRVVEGLPGGALCDMPLLTVLQRLGLEDETVTELAWSELDRAVTPDHLTSVWVPALSVPFAAEMTRLEELGRALRDRCPWDRQQTHESLARYMLEEAYEAVDAIEALRPDGSGFEHLEEELGDVLFQVVFHCVLATEEGQFGLADVARTVHDKLVARHPHVFGEVEAATAEEVARNWEQIKKGEKGQASIMDGAPGNLPALLYAEKIQGKAKSAGFDWPGPDGPLEKVAEELAELTQAVALQRRGATSPDAMREELGDLLFSVVNVARHLKVAPEVALREATTKFRLRFQALEAIATSRGRELSSMALAELDAIWDEVKSVRPGPGAAGRLG